MVHVAQIHTVLCKYNATSQLTSLSMRQTDRQTLLFGVLHLKVYINFAQIVVANPQSEHYHNVDIEEWLLYSFT